MSTAFLTSLLVIFVEQVKGKKYPFNFDITVFFFLNIQQCSLIFSFRVLFFKLIYFIFFRLCCRICLCCKHQQVNVI